MVRSTCRNIFTLMFGNPKLGIGLFLSTVVTFFLIFRQCLLLSTRFFDVFGVRENIEAYGVADKRVASGIGLTAYLIGTDAMIICTAALVWYYEYREICLVGSRKSAMGRKVVQGLRVWFYIVWLFLLLADIRPEAFAIVSYIVAVLDIFVIVLHLRMFCSRTPVEFKEHKTAYDYGKSWAQWFGLADEDEDPKKSKRERKAAEKKAKAKRKEEARRRKKRPARNPECDDSSDDYETDSDAPSDIEETAA